MGLFQEQSQLGAGPCKRVVLPKDLLGLFQAILSQGLQEEDAQSSTRLRCVLPSPLRGTKCHTLIKCDLVKVFFTNI